MTTGPLWQQATDFLARVLLGAGEADVAVALAEQLRGSGAEGTYCDWLLAQGLAQLGRPAEALHLLAGVHRLVDPAGRSYDTAQVTVLRELCAQLPAQ